LFWHEYKLENPDVCQYSQVYDLCCRWIKGLDVSLKKKYRAGEKLFVDYAGKTAPIIDPSTGEITETQIFLATLGASSYTFSQACLAGLSRISITLSFLAACRKSSFPTILRNRTFFSLSELKKAIAQKLTEFTDRLVYYQTRQPYMSRKKCYVLHIPKKVELKCDIR
jgi:hypothetical protein